MEDPIVHIYRKDLIVVTTSSAECVVKVVARWELRGVHLALTTPVLHFQRCLFILLTYVACAPEMPHERIVMWHAACTMRLQPMQGPGRSSLDHVDVSRAIFSRNMEAQEVAAFWIP